LYGGKLDKKRGTGFWLCGTAVVPYCGTEVWDESG